LIFRRYTPRPARGGAKRPELELASYDRVDAARSSDHRPVVATFALRPGGRALGPAALRKT